MILYDNRSVWRQIFQMNGSIVNQPKKIATAALGLAVVSVLLQYFDDSKSPLAIEIPSFYAVGAFVSIVAFAIVFRTSLAWQKYWESLCEVEKMYSKWTDAFTQYTVFARTTVEAGLAKGDQAGKAKAERVQEVYNTVHKHFSLLSAVAVDRLSHGDLEFMTRMAAQGSWRDQITTRAKLGCLNNVKAGRDLPRFVNREDVRAQGTSETAWTNSYVVEEMPSPAEVEALSSSEDRVNMVTVWILSGLAKTAQDLDIPPPIQSRMYQEVSNASLAFLNCMKVADTPFPFAYSQVLAYLLIVFSGLVPVISAAATHSYFMAPLISYFLFQSFWTIYEGALDLEAPFGTDLNDIPLADFHRRFCRSLVEVHTALDLVHAGKVEGVGGSASIFGGRSMSLENFEEAAIAAENSVKDSASNSSTQAVPVAVTPTCATSSWLGTRAATAYTSQLNTHVAAKAANVGLREVQGSCAGPTQGQSHGPGGFANEVIDRHLGEIGERMERHLANIAREIDAIARRHEAMGEEERRLLKGTPNADGTEYFI